MQNYRYKQKAKQALRKRIKEELSNMPETNELQEIKEKRRELFKTEKEYIWAGDIINNYFSFLHKEPLNSEILSKEDVTFIKNFKPNYYENFPIQPNEYIKLQNKFANKKKELEKLLDLYTSPKIRINGVKIVETKNSNLIQVYFEIRKPSPAMKEKLAALGFMKSNFLGCYQAHKTDNIRETVVKILNGKRVKM